MGEYIRVCRIARGLTLKEVGVACGYAPDAARKTIHAWESDAQLVPLKRLRALAKVLKVPVETLVP